MQNPSRRMSWQRLWCIFLAACLAACSPLKPSGSFTPTASIKPKPTQTPIQIPTMTKTSSPSPSPVPGTPYKASLIPRPVSETPAEGVFTLTPGAFIQVDPASPEQAAIGLQLQGILRPSTGFDLPVQEYSEDSAAGSIRLTLQGANALLGEEGYALSVGSDGITIVANAPAGLFYGVQTLRQLFPPVIDSSKKQPGPWVLANVRIQDYPRFAWRGAMLDVARHFFGVQDVKRFIDLMAYYKLNRLHLHLTDDQGWRIQINSFPNLTLHGAALEVGGTPGGFYTQEDYASIVAYAAERFITVVPEIDMPGHINAALSSYAELNCSGVATPLFTGVDVGFSSLCLKNENTYQFVGSVLDELIALTPSPYIHIGGDEAAATDPAEYVKFVGRVQEMLAAKGKQMVGWEEVAQAGLSSNAIAQHWNPNPGFVIQAISRGMKVVMSPADKAYMDQKYNDGTPLGLRWAGNVSVQAAYEWDPAAMVAGTREENILGVEATLFSETLETIKDIEYMAFPRLPGYAEIGWTPQSLRQWNEYRARLAEHGNRLHVLSVNFYAAPGIDWR